MVDQHLIHELLSRNESNDLDFKAEGYHLKNADGCSKFIKDIVAMANTPRPGPAFILIGVQEQSGKVIGVPGVTNHPDESELGRVISGKVWITPRFEYRPVSYGDVEIGVIEIMREQPGVVLPRVDYGVLRRNAVYLRRNTQNIEADAEDLALLFRPPDEALTPDLDVHRSAWEQLYRHCDGFDPRQVFIAVIDNETAINSEDWAAMAAITWNLIVDFDTGTDVNGSHAIGHAQFGDRRALHLTALDEQISITGRSAVWVAAAGLASRPTTNPTNNWRDWSRSKAPQLERIMNDLARVTEPSPVTMVVFGGDPDHVTTTCEIADRIFTDRINYVIASLNYGHYWGVEDRFEAATVEVSFPAFCQGLREMSQDINAIKEVQFPQLSGGHVEIPPDRARWMEEQLEPVLLEIGSDEENITGGDAFLRGATISWNDLNSRTDAARDITTTLEQGILAQLEDKATRRVNFWHRPGAGATTVGRRIAWNVQHRFPTVVALEIQPQETAERLQYLYGMTRLPVLVVIDLPQVPKEAVDRLYDTLRSSHTPAVLFNIERRFQNSARSGAYYLDAMLNNREAVGLSGILSARVPNRRIELEQLLHESDRRKRIPFYFGLTAFGREFLGLESYVGTRLSGASEPVREAALMLAFAYYYGQVPLSIQALSALFNVPAAKLVTLSAVVPEPIRELLVEERGGIRPAHYLVAEEILAQELGQKNSGRHNWRVGLADLGIKFIDLMSDLPRRDRGSITDVLRAVLIDRGRNQSPAGPWEAEFSGYLNHIPSVDGRQRLLEHLTNAFPGEPHFWAHLGRFYSRITRSHQSARIAHEKAIRLMPDDSLLHHMAGMGWRAELYDALDNVGPGFTDREEGVLFDKIEGATREFEIARSLDRRSDYNYISEVQMILRVIGTVGNAQGYQYQPVRFLTSQGKSAYRELVDRAQNLLSDLALIKGDETPSQLQVTLTANLENLFGKQEEAIQLLTNLLDRRESYQPPIRRAIIRNYVARQGGDWSRLSERELTRVVTLATDNIEEEPQSDYNLRLWLRGVRTANSLSVDRVAEQLAYKNLQNPSVDTKYYLYIMKFLQLESGDLAARDQVNSLVEECVRSSRELSRTTSSFEWFGNGRRVERFSSCVYLGRLGFSERILEPYS